MTRVRGIIAHAFTAIEKIFFPRGFLGFVFGNKVWPYEVAPERLDLDMEADFETYREGINKWWRVG
jgi:hypothetical protein